MKISFEECDDNIIFRIYDFDIKYENVLKMCFYQNDGNSYIKRFPKDTKYIEKIKSHFLNNAQEMFDQLGYFKPIPWEKALLEFVKRVGTDIDWWLTGSCAACIRGIPLEPHDVDIMVDSKDVERISDIFSDYLIEPIIDTNGWLTKDFGVIFLYARIDIASDPQDSLDDPEPVDCGPYAKRNLEELVWNGYIIKIPPLELQLNVNRRRERHDRVELIEEYMNKTMTL
jgi:hypothetical protein